MGVGETKESYIDYPGLGLGFIRDTSKKKAKIGIVSTGEYLTVPANDAKKAVIPQTVNIKQIGTLQLYEFIKIRTKNESYILQLLQLSSDSESGCQFAKFWKDPDTGHCRNGVLVLDTNDFFKAGKDVMRIRKLTKLPAWMRGRVDNPIIRFKNQRSQNMK